MKHLFLTSIICLMATFSVSAQFAPSTTITVDNSTNCNIFVEIFSITTGTCPVSMWNNRSGLLVLPPGIHNFDNSGMLPPGIPSGALFSHVRYDTFDPLLGSCTSPHSSWIGDVCNNVSGGFPGSGSTTFDIEDNSSSPCNCTQTGVTFDWDVTTATPTLTVF